MTDPTVPDDPLITLRYLLIESNLSMSVSVDHPNILIKHSQQAKSKHRPYTSRRTRYYIRHCPTRDIWVFEHSRVDLDEEMRSIEHDIGRASAISAYPGLDFPLVLRFGNPPGTGEELFEWPTAGRRKMVFKALGGGSMQQLLVGDPMVLQRAFFKVGLPTIRSPKWSPGYVLRVPALRRLVLDFEGPTAGETESLASSYDSESPLRDSLDAPGERMMIHHAKPAAAGRPLEGILLRPESRKNSLTTFLEFVGVSKPDSSPKKATNPTLAATPETEEDMPEDKKPPEQVEPARKPELGRRSKSWSGRLVSKGVAAVESDFTDSQETIQTAGSIDDDTTPLLAPKKESRAAFRYASPFLRKEKRAVRPSPLTRSITALDTAHIYGGPGDEKPLNEHKSVRFLERSRPVNDEESYWAGSDGHVSRTPAPPPRLLVSPGSGDYRKVLATEFGPGENPPIELTGLSPIQHPADGPGDTRPLPSPVSPPDPDYIAHVERSMAQKTNIYFPPAEREVVEEVDISLLNEEQVYAYRVGKISNWVHFPPRQVSAEFLPKSKAHWDWRPLELRGRDQFTVFSSLELDDGTRAKAVANNNWAATF